MYTLYLCGSLGKVETPLARLYSHTRTDCLFTNCNKYIILITILSRQAVGRLAGTSEEGRRFRTTLSLSQPVQMWLQPAQFVQAEAMV
ncbi:hypothetical protein [Microcoleus sp. FACHB-68]|uniref:hypothetical protein n=1 Tax=Microcoleus sp. FACHB-68 TaxID=2692826 RepID=UPI001685CBE2|nr:hypothetical protein [Microcoleus sp. FACHB-68]MBD1936304.1 hypothetical protein [Microcoleus sp. FACHB-68]